jgi:hypothetical protein
MAVTPVTTEPCLKAVNDLLTLGEGYRVPGNYQHRPNLPHSQHNKKKPGIAAGL